MVTTTKITLDISDEDVQRIADAVAERLRTSQPAPAGPADEALLSEPEAAARLNVPSHVLRDARRRGELQYSRIGRRVRYSRENLDEYLRGKTNS
jgi:excisionase family DNA binding protein